MQYFQIFVVLTNLYESYHMQSCLTDILIQTYMKYIEPSLLHASILDTDRHTALYQGRYISTDPTTSPLIYKVVLPVTYAGEMVAQSLQK